MQFLHPALLLGSLSAVGMVLAHLLGPARLPEVPLAPIQFLSAEPALGGGARRIKDSLLLLVRTLWLIVLALLCAHPAALPQAVAVPTLGQDQAWVVVVDASASMNYRIGGQTLLERARKQALARAELASPQHLVGLVIKGQDKTFQLAPTSRAAELFEALAAELPARGQGSADLGVARDAAEQMLDGIAGPHNILVITDLSHTAWPHGALATPSGSTAAATVTWLDAASRTPRADGTVAPLPNLAVTAIAPSGYRNVEVAIRNFGAKEVQQRWLTVTARGLPTQRGLVTVAPYAITRKVFSVGWTSDASIEVQASLADAPVPETTAPKEPQDGYTADDSLQKTVSFAPPVRVLAIDGSPKNLLRQSELYFVERALAQSPVGGPDFNVRVVARHQLVHALTQVAAPGPTGTPIDVLLLANVGQLTSEEATWVRRTSQAGVGLVVALGDHLVYGQDVDADVYKIFMPFEMRDVALQRDDATSSSTGRLTGLALHHPVLAGLGEAALAALKRARAHRYVFVAAAKDSRAEVVMAYSDGAPALIEAPRADDRGAVMLWTSSLDADWSDLPLMGVFVPLMQRLVSHAAPAAKQASGEDLTAQTAEATSDAFLESDFAPIEGADLAATELNDAAVHPGNPKVFGPTPWLPLLALLWLGLTALEQWLSGRAVRGQPSVVALQ